jgi:hypothetical protein
MIRYLDITPMWQALALSEDDKVGRFATGCLANMRETILAGWATPTPTPIPLTLPLPLPLALAIGPSPTPAPGPSPSPALTPTPDLKPGRRRSPAVARAHRPRRSHCHTGEHHRVVELRVGSE